MKKLLTFCLLVLFSVQITAQVGINTTSPNATLDVRSSNQAAPSNVDGILIPKIDDFPVINPGADQDAMLVYLTTTSGSNLPGFYYWDNTSAFWLPVGNNIGWSLTGNSGTIDDTSFLGTTDNVPLNFRVNNEVAGRIESDIATGITALGYQNLANNTGIYNAAFGYNALLENTTGQNNTAVGYSSFRSSLSTSENTALGSHSGYHSTGSANSYLGSHSGFGASGESTGSANTAVGNRSLGLIRSGSQNTAIGDFAMFGNTSGNHNTAVGAGALDSNMAGSRNTSVGFFSGRLGATTFTGNDNVYIGNQSGAGNSQGSNNTLIGSQANVGVNNLVYATAIGSGAVVSQNNSIALGGNTEDTRTNVGINQSNPGFSLHINQILGYGLGIQEGPNTWEILNTSEDLVLLYNNSYRGDFNFVSGVYSSISDRRLKSNIQPLDNVLFKVNQLKPSSYTFSHDENKKQQIGFIAQEVEELFPEFVHYREGTDGKRKQEDLYTMDYSGMSVIAIKAIQEQQLIIEDLIKRIVELEEKINKQ